MGGTDSAEKSKQESIFLLNGFAVRVGTDTVTLWDRFIEESTGQAGQDFPGLAITGGGGGGIGLPQEELRRLRSRRWGILEILEVFGNRFILEIRGAAGCNRPFRNINFREKKYREDCSEQRSTAISIAPTAISIATMVTGESLDCASRSGSTTLLPGSSP